ncbi:MAG: radical SAM protein [Deltaproteobacteria bacterium]|nr:radical SAM protein [Deltaproteobacteria bacterium]
MERGLPISWKLKKKVKEALAKERGTVYKDHGGKVRVCLIYPNSYSLGMTNLGFQTVYHLFNSLDGCVAERAFLPGKEEIEEFARTSTSLFSYESQTPLREFDILAFSIPFEDDYTNIPKILDLAGVPVLSGERTGFRPLVAAGGVAVSLNPEPLAELMDFFLIGEGEGALAPVIDIFRDANEKGLSKKETLKGLDSVPWAYVPSFYQYVFDGARIKEVRVEAGAKEKVTALKDFNLDKYPVPQNFIMTPDTEFKDTFLIEVERGCGRGCRFCAAGFLYLPPRWRDIDNVKEAVKTGLDGSGKVGLVGTAVSEYPQIIDTIEFGVEREGEVTLSSLRMDRLDGNLLGLLKKSGYKTITLAPEAGSERMRAVVNKGMSNDDILASIRLIKEAGFLKLKLYFLIGLPSEEDSDAEAIVGLTKDMKSVLEKGEITLSINPFIPKPFTPFQWQAFEDPSVIDRRLSIIQKGFSKVNGVNVKALSSREAFIQAYIGRADRRAGPLIIEASSKGWSRVIKKNSGLLNQSVYMERAREERLPWDMIDHGVKKPYLWKEYQKGLEGRLTAPCDVGSCFRCGVCLPEYFNYEN